MIQYYTLENCTAKAKKCETRQEFKERFPGYYGAYVRNKWFGCTEHMSPYVRWNDKDAALEAKKYKKRSDFEHNSGGAYNYAARKNILDKICSHMKRSGNRFRKCIYVYEFSDNSAYIGLTYNLEKRNKDRQGRSRDQVTNHIKNTGLNPIIKQLTEYIHVDEAIKKEDYYIRKYKRNGWNVLNVAKAGSIGGSFKWTKIKCQEASLKCKYFYEFRDKFTCAYAAVRRYGWEKEVCKHLLRVRKLNNPSKFTKEKCIEKAKKCKSRSDFQKKYPKYYNRVCNKDWYVEVCSYIPMKLTHRIWTIELCKKEALKYKTRQDFENGCAGAYMKCLRMKWLDEICKHMIQGRKPNDYWTYETIKKISIKLKKRTDLKNISNHAYNKARKNNWLIELFPIAA